MPATTLTLFAEESKTSKQGWDEVLQSKVESPKLNCMCNFACFTDKQELQPIGRAATANACAAA